MLSLHYNMQNYLKEVRVPFSMSVSKAIYAGVIATLAAFLYSMLTDGFLFSWIYLIVPGANIWNQVNAAWHVWNIVFLLVANLFLAFIYVILQESIPGVKYSKGAIFGIIVWIIHVLPSAFSAMLTMHVHMFVPVYWLISGIFKYLIIGLVLGGMLTKK